jgi:uncharacterized membrane protein
MEGTYEERTASKERDSGSATIESVGATDGVDAKSSVALGSLFVGLGLASVVAPGSLARAVGLDGAGTRLVIRALGMGQVALGVGMLRGRATSTLARSNRRASAAVSVAASVTVNRAPPEVYAFWRDLRNLARSMVNVEKVEVLDQQRSRWNVRVAGRVVTWEAKITHEQANENIRWETIEGAEVLHRGEVRFRSAPGNRGTEIGVVIDAQPPGGAAGRLLARLGQAVPRQQLTNDLRRLKQVMEVGEPTHSDASRHRGPHPARPEEKRP